MRPLNLGSCQAGFTFNEILVSINVIVIAILGYAAGTVIVIRGGSTSDSHTAAVHLAQDKMEQLKAQKTLANIDTCPGAGERTITATGGAGGIFDRCWTIADSSVGSKLKQVTVKVSWQDREHRELNFSTLVFID